MTLRVLLVGCGEHSSENLIPSLMGIPMISVTGLRDPDRSALEAAKRLFPQAVASDSEHVEPGDLAAYDAVVVAASPQVHQRVARFAIEMRKPVFVEKPPTVSTEQLVELARIAEELGVVTCVGHNLRHSDAAVQFRNVVVAPDFGRPVAMEMRYLASKPRGVRWGLESSLRSFLLSHANHAIDLMIYQMGELSEVVAARAWPDVDGGTAITAQFTFKSGAIGSLLATSYAPHFTVAATVVSDGGAVATMNDLREVEVNGTSRLGKRWGDGWRPRTLETGFRFAGYQTELERFFIAAVNGTPDTVHPSFADELSIYRAMDAIESAIEMVDGQKRSAQVM